VKCRGSGGTSLFDREATVEKTCRLTAEAASRGARLIVFPEAFIPAYPRLSFGTVVGSRSPTGGERGRPTGPMPSTCRARHRRSARRREANATWQSASSSGTATSAAHPLLHPALLRPQRALLGTHRKLKPRRGAAHLGRGDGSTLTVVETEFGKIGGLICWENYMPLARMAMYSKGVDIYLAPPPTRAIPGRPRCAISRARAAASSWGAISLSQSPCTLRA